jgi:hypothetical protein
MALPSLRGILTGLLKDLETAKADLEDDAVETDLSTQALRLPSEVLSQTAQTALLSFHQIYPHLLLPSLDLLDNNLVTRYVVPSTINDDMHVNAAIYYVRSAQSRSSRYGTQLSRAVYEVRPISWHCTCPSFTFSAFSSRNSFDPFAAGEEDYPGSDRWGGEMRGEQLAICKHLLAVLIGERIGLIPRKEVDTNTMAGYAFGDANS